MKPKVKLLALSLITVLTFSGFTAGDDGVFNNGKKWIPADFDSRNNTLLVENFIIYVRGKPNKGTLKATEQMKEHMQEKYPYKFEFINAEDMEKDKYADKDKYRYVIMWSHNTHAGSTKYTPGAPGGDFHTSVSYDSNVFHIYDRKTDTHHSDTGKPTGYAITTFKPTINTIVKFLKEIK